MKALLIDFLANASIIIGVTLAAEWFGLVVWHEPNHGWVGMIAATAVLLADSLKRRG